MSSMPEAASTSIAWSAVSVTASSDGASASIRATSIATLPAPTTTACLPCRSTSSPQWSGWPLYQATNSVAACEPRSSSPGIPSRRSIERAERVQHDVVVLEQLTAGDVAAELDMPEEPERSCFVVLSYARVTDLIFGWSGATPTARVRREWAGGHRGRRRTPARRRPAAGPRRRSRWGRRPRWRREGARSCLHQGRGRRWGASRRLDRDDRRSQTDFSLLISNRGRSSAPRRSLLGHRSPGCGRRRPREPEGSTAIWSWWATNLTCRTRGRRCRRSCWPASTRRKRVLLPSDTLRRAVAPGRAGDEARSRPAAGRARRRRRASVRPADPRHGVQGATLARPRRRAGGRPRPAQPRRRASRCGPRSSGARASPSWARASSVARSPRPRASRAST